LVSAAERLFGSWENTLYVAGIDPNLHFPHHTAKETEKDFAAGGTPESSITGVENTQACDWWIESDNGPRYALRGSIWKS
jgi:hypothetical protein